MLTHRLLLCVLLLLLCETAFSQRLNYIHYNTNNSRLPHDIVYHVRQSSDGYLWISTDDGLIRYDGTEMVEFNKGLRSRYVIATDEEKGANWISTWKGGLHVLENEKMNLVSSGKNELFSFSTNDIIAFDDLVIAYNFVDYMVFRKRKGRPHQVTPYSLKQQPDAAFWVTPAATEYYRFIKTGDHRLIAYGSKGVFSVESGKLKRMSACFIPDQISESRSGKLYLRKGNTIYRTNRELATAQVLYTIPDELLKAGVPTRFHILPSGNICIGFSDQKYGTPYVYYLVNRQSGAYYNLIEETGSKARASDLFIDNEGGIWLSTDGDGLYHIFDWKFRLFGSDVFFRNAGITCLLPMGSNRLYIGTKKGIYRYNRERPELIGNTKGLYVFRMFRAENNQAGSLIYHLATNRLATVSNDNPVTLHYENRFELPHYEVVVTEGLPFQIGVLKRFSGKKQAFVKLQHFVTTVEENVHSRQLWIAAGQSLYTYHPDKGSKQVFFPALKNRTLNCLNYEPGTGLWIGTDNGLFLLRDDHQLILWNEKQGLTNLNIRCLLSDTLHSLWIGTQNGLFHLQSGQLSVFKKRDGLIGDDVHSLAALNRKELAVASSNGISILPFGTSQKQAKAELSIEKILIDGIRRSPEKNFELSHSSRIYLLYRSTTFVYPELLRFRYRLNKNEAWISTVNKSLFLSNLKPGDYQLEISVRKYNSPFSKPLVFHFTILPPWWKSLTFVLSAIGCSILLILLFFRLQFRRQRRILRSRQEFSELKMKALQAQLNPHFISNALSVIQYYVLTRNELAVNRYLGQFSDLTRLFLEVSRKGLITLGTELELLQNYLELEQMRFGDKIRFSITLAPDIDPDSTYIPGLLVQPFVENSIHHGLVYLPETSPGIVSVAISRENDLIRIIIDDNGIGRKRSQEIKQQATKAFESRSGTILQELQNTYNSQPGCKIEILTTDKQAVSGEAAGTTVTILIRIHKRLIPDSTTHTL